MSKSDRSTMRIGCPECSSAVTASLPPGPGFTGISDQRSRLQGTEMTCSNCGHEVELYYY